MSDCRAIMSRLGRYYDGELSPVECRGIENHLKKCSRCSADLQEIREIAGVFQEGMPASPVPSDLTQRILEKARTQVDDAAPGWRFLRFWKNWSFSMRFSAVAVSAAACCLGIVLGSASLPSTHRAGDEMQWVGMTSQEPIITAYVGSGR
jgi:anti-sigma factor RsiW